MDNRNWVSPVKDQKNYGACTGFMAVAGMEYEWIKAGTPLPPGGFSEFFVYFNSRLRMGKVTEDSGSSDVRAGARDTDAS